jgi:hypothetical protein
MARKVIGPTGSRRRRWLFLFCLIAAFGTAAFVIAGAGAATGSDLYNSGMFELEGNTLANSPPNALPPAAGGTQCANPWPAAANTGGDDWAALYHNMATNGANGGPCSSNAFTFVSDGVGSADSTYWSGGGSKDAYDPALGPWQWGPNDVSPDKNDLDNAFAAIYTNPNASAHQYLYFGSDRYTTNGDAQQGFQFLQNAACLSGTGAPANAACPGSTPTTFPNTCTPSVSGSNAGYFVNPSNGCPVHHKSGDLLILVNFNNGGTLGLAGVYEWHCNQVNNADACQTGGSYTQVLVGTGADCKTLNPGQNFCSTSNTANIGNEPVWAYTAKGTTGQATYKASALVEGGVDLANIPGAGTCFPTFVAESRSSAGPSTGLSLQAQLKDLVFGKFQRCGANVTTQASTNGTVTPGTAVSDTATVTGTGPASPPTPAGTVTFYLCGPSPSTNPTCASASDGTSIGTGSLSGSGATATATSPNVNCAADGSGCATGENPLGNGYYCFLAVWPGDSNYTGGPFSNPDEAGECFRVLKINTTTNTTPQQSGSDITSVVFGTSVTDHAVVTAADNSDGDVTGTVTFTLCSPADLAAANNGQGEASCVSGGTPIGSAVTLTPTANADPPSSTADSSSSGALNQEGKWCWRAVYTPATGSSYNGSTDDSTGECFTVSKINTTTTTHPQEAGSNITTATFGDHVTDHAQVDAANSLDGDVTGTVTFYVCDPDVLAANSESSCVTGGSQVGTAVDLAPTANADPPSSTADSSTYVTANKLGTWCFRAVYTPATGSPYNGSKDDSTSECFTVSDTAGLTSDQTWIPNDTGTVTSTNGASLNGTLSIQLYTGGNCGATSGNAVSGQLYSKTVSGTSTASISSSNDANGYVVSGAGTHTVSWLVHFHSTDSNVASPADHCESSSVTITN